MIWQGQTNSGKNNRTEWDRIELISELGKDETEKDLGKDRKWTVLFSKYWSDGSGRWQSKMKMRDKKRITKSGFASIMLTINRFTVMKTNISSINNIFSVRNGKSTNIFTFQWVPFSHHKTLAIKAFSYCRLASSGYFQTFKSDFAVALRPERKA